MNRDDAQEGLMEFSRIVRLFASRIISRRHVEREKKETGKKEKGKGRRNKEVGKGNTFHASYPVESREWLLVIYWSPTDISQISKVMALPWAFAAFREKSTPRFSPTRVWSKRFVGWKKVWLYTVWSFFFLEPSLLFGRYVEMILLEAVYWFNKRKKNKIKIN